MIPADKQILKTEQQGLEEEAQLAATSVQTLDPGLWSDYVETSLPNLKGYIEVQIHEGIPRSWEAVENIVRSGLAQISANGEDRKLRFPIAVGHGSVAKSESRRLHDLRIQSLPTEGDMPHL